MDMNFYIEVVRVMNMMVLITAQQLFHLQLLLIMGFKE